MGKRLESGEWQDSCLDKLKPGEPFFVLRAQDKLAPDIIREWAIKAKSYGLPMDKYQEALDTASAMDQWTNRKYPD